MGNKRDLYKLNAALNKAADGLNRFLVKYRQNMQAASNKHGAFFVGHIRKTRFVGFASGEGGSSDKLRVRTGGLRQSFDWAGLETVGNAPVIGGRIGVVVFSSGRNYARIQEYGGEVKPKNSKYLTIPLPDNQTKAGVTRYGSARNMIETYGFWKPSEKKYGNMFFFESKKGNLLLGSRGKPGSNTRPPSGNKGKRRRQPPKTYWMFVLKESVRIPARLGFRAAWQSKEMRRDRMKRWRDAAAAAASEAKKS